MPVPLLEQKLANKTPESTSELPKVPESNEAGLKDSIENSLAQIDNDETVINETDSRVKTMQDKAGLDQKTVESIFIDKGFNESIRVLKGKIANLIKTTKNKVKALNNQTAEHLTKHTELNLSTPENSTEKTPRPKSLDEYIQTKFPKGFESLKDKAKLIQIKIQGIESPERVLGLIHYLEENGKDPESKIISLDTTLAEQEAEKYKKLGFDAKISSHYGEERKSQIFLHKDRSYSFDMKRAKMLAELLHIPNDPVQIFEQLRVIGYSPSKSDVDYNFDKLKAYMSNPNLSPFLKKLEGSSEFIGGKKDFAIGYGETAGSLLQLAEQDAQKNILNKESEKQLFGLSETLDYPIDYSLVERWIKIASDENIKKLLALAKSVKFDNKFSKYSEDSLLENLEQLSSSDLAEDLISLANDGFDLKELGLDGLEYGFTNKEKLEKIQELKNNSDFRKFLLDTSKALGLTPSLEKYAFERFQKCFKHPKAPEVVILLAETGALNSKDWEYGNYDWEKLLKQDRLVNIITEPDFKRFTATISKMGIKFKQDDFLQSNGYESWMSRAYEDDEFKKLIQSDEAVELAKRLKIFEKNGWNYLYFKQLLKSPNASKSIQDLETSYGYTYDPEKNKDNGYESELATLGNVLNNSDIIGELSKPATLEIYRQITENFGLTFSIQGAKNLATISATPELVRRLQNAESTELFKQVVENPSWHNLETFLGMGPETLQTLGVLAKEFSYKTNLDGNDYFELRRLGQNPQIIEATRKLQNFDIEFNPIKDFGLLESVIKHDLFSIIEQYKGEIKTQLFIIHNAEKITAIPKEKLGVYIDIFHKIDDSPSQEIQRLKDSLLSQLLTSQRPAEDYQKIESIFIKNNIPTVGKVFGVFETLYDPKKLESTINSQTSPVLKNASNKKRYYTIYQDLLKIHIESGNRSIKEYAEVLKSGEDLLNRYEKTGLESLSTLEQEKLKYFVGKLETLLSKSALNTADKAFKGAELENLSDRINLVREGLKVSPKQTVLERVTEMYLKPAGLKSLDELLKKMYDSKHLADQRGRQIFAQAKKLGDSEKTKLELKAGDFLKGVNFAFIENILQNGSVAKEFLGASSDSDATPLDTDISLIKPGDAETGFKHAIDTSIANGYGEILLALKDRGQYQLTETGQPAKVEAGKMELFLTGVLGDRHYGIRTGFPTTEIDFMIVQDNLVPRAQSLDKLFFEIAQNGFYIPVTDTTGKVLFTPEMFDQLKQSFAGLDKFDGPTLKYQATTPEQFSHERVSEIAESIPEDSKRVDQVTQIIRENIKQSIGNFGVSLRADFDTSILGAELLDTGSTGRHTNTPGDFDFDFSLKLDAKDFMKSAELAQAIKDTMVFTKDNSHQEANGYYQLRLTGVTSIGEIRLEKPLDIDIGFASKSDLSVYGSHDAIRDKLNYIKNNNGQEAYDQVIANIILTKQVLKEGHAYKKQEHGGFGGIGVENWILANNGNMETAFKNFKDAAYENGQRLSYSQFQEKYKILDPGINIKFNGHDNFVSILKPEGYTAMLDTIDSYFTQKLTK